MKCSCEIEDYVDDSEIDVRKDMLKCMALRVPM